MGLPQIRNGDLFSPSHDGRENTSDKFPGERAHVVQMQFPVMMHHKTQADSCRRSCSWPWTRPKAKTVRISVWFIHQAAQAPSVTNTGHAAQRQLTLSDIWHKPKGQICHLMLSHNRMPSHVQLPCQKLIKWIFPWVMPASRTGTDSGGGFQRGFFSPADLICYSESCWYNPSVVQVDGEKLHRASWEVGQGHLEVHRIAERP